MGIERSLQVRHVVVAQMGYSSSMAKPRSRYYLESSVFASKSELVVDAGVSLMAFGISWHSNLLMDDEKR